MVFFIMSSLGETSDLNAVGISVALQTLSELPWFFYSDRILNCLGANATVSFSLLVLIARSLSNSQVQSAWMFFPLQLLHGAMFACFNVAAIELSRQHAPSKVPIG